MRVTISRYHGLHSRFLVRCCGDGAIPPSFTCSYCGVWLPLDEFVSLYGPYAKCYCCAYDDYLLAVA